MIRQGDYTCVGKYYNFFLYVIVDCYNIFLYGIYFFKKLFLLILFFLVLSWLKI
jgi:hypothetical protein